MALKLTHGTVADFPASHNTAGLPPHQQVAQVRDTKTRKAVLIPYGAGHRLYPDRWEAALLERGRLALEAAAAANRPAQWPPEPLEPSD